MGSWKGIEGLSSEMRGIEMCQSCILAGGIVSKQARYSAARYEMKNSWYAKGIK